MAVNILLSNLCRFTMSFTDGARLEYRVVCPHDLVPCFFERLRYVDGRIVIYISKRTAAHICSDS